MKKRFKKRYVSEKAKGLRPFNDPISKQIYDELDKRRDLQLQKDTVKYGAAKVNDYLQKHNRTLNGKPMQVSQKAVDLVEKYIDWKYTKDALKSK